MKAIVIVAAGGVGSRFGADRPKQFSSLCGKTVLEYSCARFSDRHLVVVIDPQWREYLPQGAIAAKPGLTRWQSVKNALDVCKDVDADVIMVHDGARPLVSDAVIERVVAACADHQGAVPVVPVVDSLRTVDGLAVNRSQFRAVQTPQCFRADLLRQAYSLPERPEFTDDASVMTAAGFADIAMVEGDVANLKITNPIDLEIAELWMRRLK